MLNNISVFFKSLYLCTYLPRECAHACTYICNLEAIWIYCHPIMVETWGEQGAKRK